MPINFSSIEALVALITIIAFLVSVGKWIQMREAIAQRVIDVDTQLKEINEWRRNCPVRADEIYVRKEHCGLHMDNFDTKFENIETSLQEIKDTLKEMNTRRR
jgi:methyl-accepting chemotaxis protein